MIPKIIHYCWFGGRPLSESALKCIASWKKYCPGYEIRKWDESNFDVNCNDYVQEAYAAKKWAFVSDYARFQILYEHGGLYFDTDVELIRPIEDIVLQGRFMGLEQTDLILKNILVNPGLGMGADSELDLYKKVLESYRDSHFILNERGEYETVVVRVTRILEQYGKLANDKIVRIANITIYPPEYFCPLNYWTGELTITENTRSIHHYTATWHNGIEKAINWVERRFVGHRRLARIFLMPLRISNKIKMLGVMGMFRFAVRKLTGKEFGRIV